jgi:hypothetical protein
MNTITLLSLAIPPSQHNNQTISYFAGKPQTVVEGDCDGFRMRKPNEPVHYREDEDNPVCTVCGHKALVWLGSVDRWGMHPARCK